MFGRSGVACRRSQVCFLSGEVGCTTYPSAVVTVVHPRGRGECEVRGYLNTICRCDGVLGEVAWPGGAILPVLVHIHVTHLQCLSIYLGRSAVCHGNHRPVPVFPLPHYVSHPFVRQRDRLLNPLRLHITCVFICTLARTRTTRAYPREYMSPGDGGWFYVPR